MTLRVLWAMMDDEPSFSGISGVAGLEGGGRWCLSWRWGSGLCLRTRLLLGRFRRRWLGCRVIGVRVWAGCSLVVVRRGFLGRVTGCT